MQESGLEWTVVRASWFHQNFSEGAFLDMVHAGQITLPAGDILEPFVDVDDIATDLSRATGRVIGFVEIPHDAFVAGALESGAPRDFAA